MTICINNLGIDEKVLHKEMSKQKAKQILSYNAPNGSNNLVKVASSEIGTAELIDLFKEMLKSLNIKYDPNAAMKQITAKKKTFSFEESEKTIKIVSKHLKDSHYEIDVSKDLIKHNGKRLIMVSCYCKDIYLGRYIIKRNFFFDEDRVEAAEKTCEEVVEKMSLLKDRYYEDIIGIEALTTQMKKILDGVISELKIEEDSIGQIRR